MILPHVEQTVVEDQLVTKSVKKLTSELRRHLEVPSYLGKQRCRLQKPKNCVRLPLDISDRNEIELLVDTGAEKSIIKSNRLHKNAILNDNEKIEPNTAFGTGKTLGTCNGIFLTNPPQPCKFHVIPDNDNIPGDGILGNDFLSKNCSIDGPNQLLRFPCSSSQYTELCIPLTTPRNKDTEFSIVNWIPLPTQKEAAFSVYNKEQNVEGSESSEVEGVYSGQRTAPQPESNFIVSKTCKVATLEANVVKDTDLAELPELLPVSVNSTRRMGKTKKYQH